ncbi:MAG: EAL domain-containing protein [Euzebyaceae bacterium]|jgi:diguanylate cyclase (GGDEF)-like protein|nr:EAL domain-containing protein [Euzebyaceae bacterium]
MTTHDPAAEPAAAHRLWLLAAAMVAAAIALFAALPAAPAASGSTLHLPWWSLLIAFTAAEASVVTLRLRRESMAFSLSEIPLMVGLAFVHPATLVLTRVIGSAAALAWRRQSPLKLSYNLAGIALEGVLAALVWHAVLAGGDPLGSRGWLAVVAVVVVTDLVSTGSVTLAMAVLGGQTNRKTILPVLASGSVAAFTNASFAVVIVAVLTREWRAGWALLVITAVLFAAYRSYTTLRRRHEALEQLTEFTPALDADLGTATIAADVVARVRTVLNAQIAELVLHAAADAPGVGAVQRQTGLQLTSAGTGSIAASLGVNGGQSLLAPHGSRTFAAKLSSVGLRDAAVVPLIGDKGVSGTLLVADSEAAVETFDAEALQILQTLANHAAVALANSRLAERLRAEAAERRNQALHDALTGLGNRTMFQEEARQRIAGGEHPAVLLLDVDRFKEVNDTLGHHTGDLLLVQIGDRLRNAFPGAVVARFGGDEFALLIDGGDPVAAANAAHRVLAALADTFQLGDMAIHVDASIGIAHHPDDGHDIELLLQRADVAMYAAKRGSTGVERYSPAADQYSPKRLSMVGELRQAIDSGGLDVHYQPKVDVATGDLVGVEALVRWAHPRHGFLPPDEFIPLAEQTGLIKPLTASVLSTALRQRQRWAASGLDVGLAVNLSPRSLVDPALLGDVARLLHQAGTTPSSLTLEITETSLITDPARAEAALVELSAMGVRLSLDDFGTGYSSLSHLWTLPVEELKIDKSFVMGTHEPRAASIVDAIVDLGRRLGKRVVAEGVEDAGTWRRLVHIGCDTAQGFAIGRPMPGSEIPGWAQEWARSGLHQSVGRRPYGLVATGQHTRGLNATA